MTTTQQSFATALVVAALILMYLGAQANLRPYGHHPFASPGACWTLSGVVELPATLLIGMPHWALAANLLIIGITALYWAIDLRKAKVSR
jgi:hypothetical protein